MPVRYICMSHLYQHLRIAHTFTLQAHNIDCLRMHLMSNPIAWDYIGLAGSCVKRTL